MNRATFDTHAARAVAEPVPAPKPPPGRLLAPEAALLQHLRALAHGRLEQEFLPAPAVAQAVQGWALQGGGGRAAVDVA